MTNPDTGNLDLPALDAATHEMLDGARLPEAILRMRILCSTIPVGGLLVALATRAQLGLTEPGMRQVRRHLKERRGTA